MKDCLYTVTADGQELVFTYDGLRGYLLDMTNLSALAPGLAAKNAKNLNITGAVKRPVPAAPAPPPVTVTAKPAVPAEKKPPTEPAKPAKAKVPAKMGEPVTEASLKKIFNLTAAKAKVVLALWKAMGIPIDRIRLRKGDTAVTGLLQKAYHAARQNFVPEEGFPNGRFRLDKVGTDTGLTRYGWGIYFASSEREANEYADVLREEGATPAIYQLDIPDALAGRLLDYNKPIPGTLFNKLLVQVKKAGLDIDEITAIRDESFAEVASVLEDVLIAGDDPNPGRRVSEIMAAAGIPGITVRSDIGPMRVIWDQKGLDSITLAPINKAAIKELREEVAAIPLPSDAPTTVNGFIEFLNSDQQELAEGALAIIQGFEGGNLSTAVHEAFHFYRRFLMNTANGFEQSELDRFAEWAGVKNGQWTVEAEEKGARAFEKYLYEGAMPQGATHQLLQIFAKMAEWMKEVYKTLSGSAIDVAIPDDIRKIFDKIFVQGELYKNQPMILMEDGQVIAGLQQVGGMTPTTFERFKRAGQALTSFLKQIGDKNIGKYTRSERAELDRHLGAVERAAGITPTRLYQDNRTDEKRIQEAQEIIDNASSPEAAKAAREKRLAEMQAARAAFLRGEISSAEMRDRTVRPAKQPLTTEEKVKTRKESTKEAFGGQSIKEYAEGMIEQAKRGDLSGPTPPVAKRVEGDIRSVLRRAALALNEGRMNQDEFDDFVRQAEELFDIFKSGVDRDADTYKKAKANIWRDLSKFAPPRTRSASRQKRRGFGDRTITEVLQGLIEKARKGDPSEERELTDRETAEGRIMRGLNKAVLAETVDGTAPAGTIDEMLRLGQQWLDVLGSQDAEAVQMAEELFRQAAAVIKVDAMRKKKPTRKARKALEVVLAKVQFEARQEAQQKNTPKAAKDLAEIERSKTERAVERWLKRYEEATQKGLLAPTMDNVFTGEAGVDRKAVLMAALEAYREARDHGDIEARIYAERVIRDAISVPRSSDIYADMTDAQRILAKGKKAARISEFRTPLSVLNIIGTYEALAGTYGAQISTIFHTIHARLARNQYLGMTEAIGALKESLGLTRDYKLTDDGYLRFVEEMGYAGVVEMTIEHVKRIESNYEKMLKTSREWRIMLDDKTPYIESGQSEPRVFRSKAAAEAFKRQLSNAIPELKNAKVKPRFKPLERLFDDLTALGALEAFARISKAYVYRANLQYNLKSTGLNYVTLALTIWPHVTTKEFAQILKQAATDPEQVATIALREAGGFYDVPGSEIESELGQVRRRDMFAKSNQFARIAGHYTGLMLARRAKMTPEARDIYVKQWTERVEFDNSQWNALPAISGDIASWLLQFKPFLIKNFERLWADMARPVPYSNQTPAMRRGKLLFAMFAVGGLNTILSVIPGVRPIMGPLLLGGLAYALAAAGLDDDEAEEWAQGLMYGLPSFFGLDLAGSMLFTDELIGNSMLEQVSNFMLGPSVNKYIKNVTLGGKLLGEMFNERSLAEPEYWDTEMDKAFWKFAQSVTPLARQAEAGGKGIGAAAGITEKPMMRLGKEEEPLTTKETLVRALGGTPVKQSAYYEKQALREAPGTSFLAEKLLGAPRTIEGLPRQTGETDEQYKQRRELQRIWLGTFGEQLRRSPRFQDLPLEDRQQIEKNFKSRVIEQTKTLPSKRRLKSLTPQDVLSDYFRSQERKQRETPVPQRPK